MEPVHVIFHRIHLHVSDVDGYVQRMKHPVDGRRRGHEARVDCAADGSAQGIPSPVIEPVQEV